MRGKCEGNYYIGLDIGTNSVGWAVSDEEYSIPKTKGKQMWGIRLFDEANTAAERRVFRSSRRRVKRRIARIRLLQEMFSEEIFKIDPGFFMRMKDSKFLEEDKANKQAYTLFNDKDFTDVKFHKTYKTIYHLRKELILSDKPHDVRLVYLAIHHILKHRGHFLFEGNNMKKILSFSSVYENMYDAVKDVLDIEITCSDIGEFEKVMQDRKISNSDRKKHILKILDYEKEDEKKLKEIVGLISGLTAKTVNIFDDVEGEELPKLCFSDNSFEEKRDMIEEIVLNRTYLVDNLKAVYDWAILSDVLKGGNLNDKQYFSVAKVNLYDKHKFDLRILKSIIKEMGNEKDYENMFKCINQNNNYSAYIGKGKINGRKVSVKHCCKEDFYKRVKEILGKYNQESSDVKYILGEISKGTLLPLQKSTTNSVVPYQVHKMELEEILDNAAKYLAFLNKEDESGYSVKEKISKLLTFRIPYYVGPLNDYHKDKGGNCWIVRREEGKIYPWNFEEKVDLEASDEAFIRRMTNKCTYLIGEDVLAKNSLLYSEFMVLNELNNLRINGEKVSVELKLKLLNNLFMKRKNITGKALLTYLKSEGYEVSESQVSGFDKNFKGSLTSYLDFSNRIGIDLTLESNKEMVEEIIFWRTIHSEGGKVLRRRIEKNYGGKLSKDQIKNICNLKYSGWGRLSAKFLNGIERIDKETGEKQSIISALRNTNENLMMLLSDRYTYSKKVNLYNKGLQSEISEISYESLVKDLYVSPSIKRGIWQTVLITEEIRKIMGKEPKKIFIEMARGAEEKKRTISRKHRLLNLYGEIKDEERDWKNEIEKIPERKFLSKKLYLYYTQMGRSMYTGRSVDLDQLFNNNIYDLDHIYPQSKTKDDSILNNLVLVEKNINNDKQAGIVPLKIQKKRKSFWVRLLKADLITKEKYKRLTRNTMLTNEELAGFINRQLVETRQSTKAIASLMRNLYESSEIVYVRAKSVSEFRNEKLNMFKVRELNDFHHAKDAYLNIVVGNVYHTKFTFNPYNWLNTHKDNTYNMNRMYDFDLKNGEGYAWKRGKEGSIKVIKDTMNSNRILYTRYSSCKKGMLFDQQIVKKGAGQIQIKKDERLTVENYGGYNKVKASYFMLVKSTKKNEKILTIESFPIYLYEQLKNDKNKVKDFCENEYGLQDAKVLINQIKIGSLFIIDGFPMHLRGRTGKQMVLQGAVQLTVEKKEEEYIKRVYKYVSRNADSKEKENIKITEYDGVDTEHNLMLYDYLISKHKDTIYSNRPASQVDKLIEKREKFKERSIENQCIVLSEIVKLFACKPITANLKLIEGAPMAGKILKNKEISKARSALLVHQSPTGLYQQTIDLLKL